MVNFFKSRSALMAGFLFLGAASTGLAQNSAQTVGPDNMRKDIVRAITQKLLKSHYSPRAIDDQYSALVWDQFLNYIDPNRYIFLQEDINKLNAYRNLLDDEINNGSNVEFFNLAWKLYATRIQEFKIYVEKSLKQPLDLSRNEIFTIDRKKSVFPANASEREKLWSGFLKYGFLKNYADLQTTGSTVIDTALEKKTRDKVSTWYRRFFTKEQKSNAIDEKFSLYMNAITLSMDPHTGYTLPDTEDNLMASVMGRFYGIGMEMGIGEIDVFVKRLVPGGAAFKSGLLKENDRILAVADKTGKMISTADLEPNEVTSMIRGEEGTSVTMQVMQPGQPERTISIKRERVPDNPNKAKSAVISQNGKKIGLVYLPLFYVNPDNPEFPGCSGDVRMEIEKLKDQDVDGIIFDLRGNGGGSLSEVVRMGSSFMPQSVMSLLRGRDKVDEHLSPNVPPQYEGPLAVLIDEGSASASEIFAAAIQDHHRGLIVGTTASFGKGTSQIPMNIGKMGDPSKGTADIRYGSMRLTVQKFYRANGTTTQMIGVKSDVVLTDKYMLNISREAEMPAVLQADTLDINKARQVAYSFPYRMVVDKAQQRAKANTALQMLAQHISRLQQLQLAPAPLSLAGYLSVKKEMKELEEKISHGKILQQTFLNVTPSFFTRVNPGLQQRDESQEKLYRNWLDTLSKDLLLAETVELVQDMINASGNKN
ncbi:MAG: S41 family peptidase [Pseudobacter sp.]|uniref:S41 family peptidase n=1 Tax=Pseudobacter sp. TaxID=2045420 RepID=UPI003F807F2C